jgi:hypothetical protein
MSESRSLKLLALIGAAPEWSLCAFYTPYPEHHA